MKTLVLILSLVTLPMTVNASTYTRCIDGYLFVIATSTNGGIGIAQVMKEGITYSKPPQPRKCGKK